MRHKFILKALTFVSRNADNTIRVSGPPRNLLCDACEFSNEDAEKNMLTKKIFFTLFLAVVVNLVFQNCGQNMTAVDNSLGTNSQTDPSSLQTTLVPCIASGCPQSSEYIQVAVANSDPIAFVVNSTGGIVEGVVDVAGYCNIAGYPSSHIYYSVQDDAGNVAIASTLSNGACDSLGRFAFSVTISSLAGNKNYHISVVLKAVDSTGVEFESPLGRNRKQIGLNPRTGV